uniref:Alpha-1,3-glucosyltransferase n=1 Tax=Panagrolaimus sp. ES5 TaxID=591445 RepID=A0AC34F1T3_9BILA
MWKRRRNLHLEESEINIKNTKLKSNDIQRLKTSIIEKIEAQNEVYGWIALIAAFLAIQAVVSTGNYSGYSNAPKFGDFEAQRHWMEITLHLPINQWYVNSTDNDLSYWGLDYPPLTAYHSYILGKISNALNPSWVELHKSRGYQTTNHLAFMRTTVIITMLFLYAPALILTLRGFLPKNMNFYDRFVIGLAALLYPGLIYIDNGHFQYNHVALGFFIWAICCFQKRKVLWGSFFFVLALNFKQMELYHSLPIFVYLLSLSCASSPSVTTRITRTICNVSKLGNVVIFTFVLLWLPFFQNIELFKQVLRRIFPFERGIFEDKVANFWCSLNVIYKLKTHLSTEILIQISLLFVLASALPSLYVLFKKPNDKNFRLSLTITSLSFFMFSYHVHEKTILQCAIPALFLLPDYYEVVTIFLDASSISIFGLCIKDEIPEILFMFFVYHIVTRILCNHRTPKLQLLKSVQIAISLAICGLQLFGVPPKRYPYLFELLNAVFSFGIFALFWLYLNYVMLSGYVLQRQNVQQKHQQSSQKKKVQ